MNKPLIVLIAIMVAILGFLVVYSQTRDETTVKTKPGQNAAGGYGSAAPASGGYGSSPATHPAGGYGAPPAAGGYGTPPAAGGYGAPKAPAAGGYK
jgi:hypothetical protein